MKKICIIGNTIESKLLALIFTKMFKDIEVRIFTNNENFVNHFPCGIENPPGNLSLLLLLRSCGITEKEYLENTNSTFSLALQYNNINQNPLYRTSEANITSINLMSNEYQTKLLGKDLRRESLDLDFPTVLGDLRDHPDIEASTILELYVNYLLSNQHDLFTNLFLFDPAKHYFPTMNTIGGPRGFWGLQLTGLQVVQYFSYQFTASYSNTNLHDLSDKLVWNHDIQGLNTLLESKINSSVFIHDPIQSVNIQNQAVTMEESRFSDYREENIITNINNESFDFVIDTIGLENFASLLSNKTIDCSTNPITHLYQKDLPFSELNDNRYYIDYTNIGFSFRNHLQNSTQLLHFTTNEQTLEGYNLLKNFNSNRPKHIVSYYQSWNIEEEDRSPLPYSNYILFNFEKYNLNPILMSDISFITHFSQACANKIYSLLTFDSTYRALFLCQLQYDYLNFLTQLEDFTYCLLSNNTFENFRKYSTYVDDWNGRIPILYDYTDNENVASKLCLKGGNIYGDSLHSNWEYLSLHYQKGLIQHSTIIDPDIFIDSFNFEKNKRDYVYRDVGCDFTQLKQEIIDNNF